MKRSAADPGRWTAAPEKRKKKNGNEFWELLQQHQGDLTKSGRTVADYLVQHAAEAQYLSISSLAKECCVAEATVFRFCRALGFEGYHEMRIALAQANATGALVNQHVPEPDADTATLCEHASALLMTTINGTQNNLSPEAVDKASELMHKARQVYCLGQGGSMYIANDICARFACISTKFRTAGDSHMQAIAASLMGPEDVVVFVSYSGVMDGGTMTSTSGLALSRQHSVCRAFLTSRTMP